MRTRLKILNFPNKKGGVKFFPFNTTKAYRGSRSTAPLSKYCPDFKNGILNPLNAELNPICHFLALGAHHILHVSRRRVNINDKLRGRENGTQLIFDCKYPKPSHCPSVSRNHTVTNQPQLSDSTNIQWRHLDQSILKANDLHAEKVFTLSSFKPTVQTTSVIRYFRHCIVTTPEHRHK